MLQAVSPQQLKYEQISRMHWLLCSPFTLLAVYRVSCSALMGRLPVDMSALQNGDKTGIVGSNTFLLWKYRAPMRRSPIYGNIQMTIFKNKHNVQVQLREVLGLSLGLGQGTSTEIFRELSQSLQTNAGIVPQIRP
jgi:hypothetical protein